MNAISMIRQFFLKVFKNPGKEINPEQAYDAWSSDYDNQPGNLILDLDEVLFGQLMTGAKLEGKTVVDIGCGTGRHWKMILSKSPQKLIGFDVSAGMLNQLQLKYPNAITYQLKDHRLPELPSGSCDLILSTLALAHMEDPELVLQEWCRVLGPDGEIMITDYHPEALARGGTRTFIHQGTLMTVKSHVHPLDFIRRIARQLNLVELRFSEKRIDDDMKGYYEKLQALPVFEKFKGVRIIYSFHFKKGHVSQKS